MRPPDSFENNLPLRKHVVVKPHCCSELSLLWWGEKSSELGWQISALGHGLHSDKTWWMA